MAAAKRPSIQLSNKVNVIPVGNRLQEATAEDYIETAEILNDHAEKLDALTGAATPSPKYGTYTSLELLQVAYPVGEANAYAIIDAGIGATPQLALWDSTDLIWTINSVAENVKFVLNAAARPAPGLENMIYITLDNFKAYVWKNAQYNLIFTFKNTSDLINNGEDTVNPFITLKDLPLENNASNIAQVYATWTGTGLNFLCKGTNIPINDIFYNGAQETVTLDPNTDPILQRIDLIGFFAPVSPATVGNFGFIKGDLASVEIVLPPNYDASLFYPIKPILVKNGATVPSDPGTGNAFANVKIYGENLGQPNEWTTAVTANLVKNSVNTPNSGTFCIEGTNISYSDKSTFTYATPKNVNDLSELEFFIKLKASIYYAFIRIEFYLGNKKVGALIEFRTGTYGFDSYNITSYQQIIINKTSLNLPSGATYDKILIYPYVNGNAGYFLDDISIKEGSGTVINVGIDEAPLDGYYVRKNKAWFSLDTLMTAWNNAVSWLNAHLINYANPHQVTKAQVGLDNADNTSDANKPVSILQAAADATVLADGKTYADGLITQIINGAPADANTLKELNDKILAVQAIIGGTTADGDAIVNTVAELLAVFNTYPEGADLVTLLAGKVNTTDVYNALDCIVAGKILDARQGKVLNDLITALTTVVNNKVSFPEAPIDTKSYARKDGAWVEVTSGGLGIVTTAATAYTFTITDPNKNVTFTAATAVTATIPTNAVTAIPIGSKIEITQSGAGVVTLVTTGLTVITASPLILIQGQTVTLVKTAIDTWTIDSSTTTNDMFVTGAQTVSGIKTFLAGMFGLRNTANTFTSFFASAVTASRIWTLPDKAGTVAMTSDIIAQLNGTVNYLVKFGTATTGVVSRLWDTGTFFGIGTVNSPLKDITLGNQGNKEIGIELSNSTTVGRDLIISAGKSVNYQLNTEFISLNQPTNSHTGMTALSNNNIYVSTVGGQVLMQTNGTGLFSQIQAALGTLRTMGSDYNGNVYTAGSGTSILKQTNGIGSFVSLNQTARMWYGVNGHPNGNIYACEGGEQGIGDIYMQTNGVGDFIALNQTKRNYSGIFCHPNGNVYVADYTNGDIYMQTNGVGDFISINAVGKGGRQFTVAPNNNLYSSKGGYVYMQANSTGVFVQVGFMLDVRGITSDIYGNIYAACNNRTIYFQNNDSIGLPNLDGGTLIQKAGTGKGTGKSRYEIWTGQKTASGTNMQLETLRTYVDENGYLVHLSTPIYADNAAALAGGLVVGTHYRTATGISMIVY